MTVYVDNYQLAATINGVTAVWSHLMAHTDEELLAFARELGVSRPGTHRSDVAIPRLGITDDERDRAISAGAFEITVDQARALAVARRRIEVESIQVAEEAITRCRTATTLNRTGRRGQSLLRAIPRA